MTGRGACSGVDRVARLSTSGRDVTLHLSLSFASLKRGYSTRRVPAFLYSYPPLIFPPTSLCSRSPAALLNRYDRNSMNGEAEVKYLDGDFRVVRPGAYVRCAVTGVPIPLEELKYWSVDRQEAYVSPEAVLKQLNAAT